MSRLGLQPLGAFSYSRKQLIIHIIWKRISSNHFPTFPHLHVETTPSNTHPVVTSGPKLAMGGKVSGAPKDLPRWKTGEESFKNPLVYKVGPLWSL